MRSARSRLSRRALVASGVAVLAASRVATAQTLDRLRVVGPANDGAKAVFYAVRSGLFRRYNLEVETSVVASGAAAAAALIGGSAEVAFTNSLTLIQARARGIPMMYVAGGALVLTERPISLLLVLKDSPIRTGRDLSGKTLGSVSLRDLNSAAALLWIDKAGGDSKTVHVIEVPLSAGAAFLQEHRADAVILNEIGVAQALATGTARVLVNPYDAVAPRVQAAGFAAMETYVDQHRDVMGRFARAMHESSVYTNTHPAETVELVASYSGAKPEVIAKTTRVLDAEYVDPRDLQPLIDLSAKYGLVDRSFPAAQIISSAALKMPS